MPRTQQKTSRRRLPTRNPARPAAAQTEPPIGLPTRHPTRTVQAPPVERPVVPPTRYNTVGGDIAPRELQPPPPARPLPVRSVFDTRSDAIPSAVTGAPVVVAGPTRTVGAAIAPLREGEGLGDGRRLPTRTVVAAPSAAVPGGIRSADVSPMTAHERLLQAIEAPVAGNRGMSALHGAGQGLAQAQGSNSLGYMIGAALGGGLGGLLNKKLYGDTQKQQAIAQAQQAAGIESVIGKEKREAEASAAEIDYKRAQTEKARQPLKPPTPIFKKLNGQTVRVNPEDNSFTPLTDQNGQMLPPEYGEPKLREILGDDGVTKELMQWNPESRTWGRLTVEGRPTRTGYVQPVDPVTGMTSAQQRTDEDRDAGRTARSDVERMRIDARGQIAKVKHDLQRERVNLSKEQFKAKYPHAGKTVTNDALVEKWQRLRAADPQLRLKSVLDAAIKEGITIID